MDKIINEDVLDLDLDQIPRVPNVEVASKLNVRVERNIFLEQPRHTMLVMADSPDNPITNSPDDYIRNHPNLPSDDSDLFKT
ncbi:hypothetical protein FRX31_034057 [Thalictrum thalictroides]|uniref:Uncharacterized protein n=1 Tax=Thalictrum thalictroides TaxID=46969 RepID=A0A7J6UUV4_THATH|nr:hypothetical protein FRX31_034057 [Thalictrum thalictroides]